MEHPDIAGITFVGLTRAGKYIYAKCGQLGKRAIAQASAKNFMVIMPDCNVERTIPAMMTSFFGNTG